MHVLLLYVFGAIHCKNAPAVCIMCGTYFTHISCVCLPSLYHTGITCLIGSLAIVTLKTSSTLFIQSMGKFDNPIAITYPFLYTFLLPSPPSPYQLSLPLPPPPPTLAVHSLHVNYLPAWPLHFSSQLYILALHPHDPGFLQISYWYFSSYSLSQRLGFVLFTGKAASAQCKPSAEDMRNERFCASKVCRMYSLWFPVVEWLQVALMVYYKYMVCSTNYAGMTFINPLPPIHNLPVS